MFDPEELAAYPTTVEIIRISDVIYDKYQRPFKLSWAREIARDFRWDSFGFPYVNIRDNGVIAGVDCQHRFGALKIKDILYARCEVAHGLTYEQEAEIHDYLNTDLRQTSLDRFKVRYEANKSEERAISALADKYGLTIEFNAPGYYGKRQQHKSKTLWAVSTLKQLYRRGDIAVDILDHTFDLLVSIWPESGDAFLADVIDAVAYFYEQCHSQSCYNREDCISRLSDIDIGGTLRWARANAEQRGKSARLKIMMAEKLVNRYNKYGVKCKLVL